jgi:hypothetical protein
MMASLDTEVTVNRFRIGHLALPCILTGVCALPPILAASEPKSSRHPDDNLLESFTFDPDWGTVTVPVELNGKTYRFIVDTGCTVTILDASLQPETKKVVGKARVNSGLLPTQEHDLFSAPDARIGSLTLPSDYPVVYIDFTRLREVSGVNFYGILGLTFLHAFVVQIDCDEGRVDLLQHLQPDNGVRGEGLPFVPHDGEMWVMATVGDDQRVPFVIDTGCVATGILAQSALESLADKDQVRWLRTATVATLDGTDVTSAQVRLATFALGSFRHHGLLFLTGKKNVLGLDVLRRFRITIDGPGEMLYLAKGKHFEDPDRDNNWGFKVIFRAGKTLIEVVEKESVAAQIGLHPGDVVLEIGGKTATGLTQYQVARLLTADPSSGIDMVVDRDGRRMNFTLCPGPSPLDNRPAGEANPTK